jgi:molecular chaperone GrpE
MSRKQRKNKPDDREEQDLTEHADEQPVDEGDAAGAGRTEVGDDIGAVRAERDDLRERLQRVSADYLNYKKRAQRDAEQARQFANEDLMKALLSVLDDMERALDAARADHSEDDPLLKGMQIVHDNALQTLGRFGLETIEAEGTPFDPDRHAAMMQEPSDEHPPQTVLRELQRGYQLHGRTIRPAAVVVSAPPEEEPEAEAPDETFREQQGGA